jgi:hypothetical protein
MSNELIETVKKNGIVKIKNFLSDTELGELQTIIRYYSAPKSSKNSYWPTTYKHLLYKILKLDFIKFKFSLKILNFEKKKNLSALANQFYNKKSYLKFIDAYYSPISNKNIINWHTDQAYHGNLNPKKYVNPDHFFLKIFIYLTDVTSQNGCMSYIPESHKIGYAIRKGIFENKIAYKPYWHLNDFRKIITESDNSEFFSDYFKDQEHILKDFLRKTENISNNLDTKEFDYSLKAGSAIIFDEGGVHKGSKTLEQDRMILRYIYSNFK